MMLAIILNNQFCEYILVNSIVVAFSRIKKIIDSRKKNLNSSLNECKLAEGVEINLGIMEIDAELIAISMKLIGVIT